MRALNKPSGRRSEPDKALTMADIVVLSLLDEKPMHGYDLLAEYDRQEVSDWASVSKAQVYYALKKLAKLLLVLGHAQESGGRERIIYAVTPKGRTALIEALMAKGWANQRQASPFSTWYGLSIALDQPAIESMLEQRLVFLHAELSKEKASLAFIKTLNSARGRVGERIVDLVIRQIETEVAWIKDMGVGPD
jgi:DNA-binding PadR family transcriptional regulator